MTALDTRTAIRPLTAPAVWSGRILHGVIGGFLAAEGLSRIVWGRAMVTPSEAAPVLAQAGQLGLGASLLLGAGALFLPRGRLVGTALLTLALAGLIAIEAQAASPSAGHILFWAYVGLLTWAGDVLRGLNLGARRALRTEILTPRSALPPARTQAIAS